MPRFSVIHSSFEHNICPSPTKHNISTLGTYLFNSAPLRFLQTSRDTIILPGLKELILQFRDLDHWSNVMYHSPETKWVEDPSHPRFGHFTIYLDYWYFLLLSIWKKKNDPWAKIIPLEIFWGVINLQKACQINSVDHKTRGNGSTISRPEATMHILRSRTTQSVGTLSIFRTNKNQQKKRWYKY